jgi:hypothetical protein
MSVIITPWNDSPKTLKIAGFLGFKCTIVVSFVLSDRGLKPPRVCGEMAGFIAVPLDPTEHLVPL